MMIWVLLIDYASHASLNDRYGLIDSLSDDVTRSRKRYGYRTCICARSSPAACSCTCSSFSGDHFWGDRREFSWKLIRKNWVYRTPSIIMLSASSTSKRLLSNINPCVDKRRTHNLYPLFCLSHALLVLLTQAQTLHRSSDVGNWFWTFVISESFIISKTFSNDSIVGTIIVRGMEVIGCTRSYDRSSDLRGVAKRSLAFSSFFSSSSSSSSSFSSFFSSFLSRLEADAASATISLLHAASATVSLSHARAVNDLSQRFDNRLKMFVQHDVLLDSIGLQNTIFLVDRLALLDSSSWSSSWFFHARAHQLCSSLAKYQSTTSHVTISQTR